MDYYIYLLFKKLFKIIPYGGTSVLVPSNDGKLRPQHQARLASRTGTYARL